MYLIISCAGARRKCEWGVPTEMAEADPSDIPRGLLKGPRQRVFVDYALKRSCTGSIGGTAIAGSSICDTPAKLFLREMSMHSHTLKPSVPPNSTDTNRPLTVRSASTCTSVPSPDCF